MSTLVERPHPEPSVESAPYWQALREHRLVVQSCRHCGRLRHYPRTVCEACFGLEYDWVELPGRGSIHSWTVTHHPFHFAFKPLVPYITVTVDLAPGVRMMAPLAAAATTPLALGMPVVLGYEELSADLTLPLFTLARR
jgi:uncharacterized OB-fold protein